MINSSSFPSEYHSTKKVINCPQTPLHFDPLWKFNVILGYLFAYIQVQFPHPFFLPMKTLLNKRSVSLLVYKIYVLFVYHSFCSPPGYCSHIHCSCHIDYSLTAWSLLWAISMSTQKCPPYFFKYTNNPFSSKREWPPHFNLSSFSCFLLDVLRNWNLYTPSKESLFFFWPYFTFLLWVRESLFYTCPLLYKVFGIPNY